MQDLERNLKTKLNVKQSTLTRYLDNLSKLAKKYDDDYTFEFLNAPKKVISNLKLEYKDTTVRNYLNAIIILLGSGILKEMDFSLSLESYITERDVLNSNYFKSRKTASIPSSKQISSDEINGILKNLEDIIKKYKIWNDGKDTITKLRYNIILEYTVLSFYNEYKLRNDLANLRLMRSQKEYNQNKNKHDNFIVCASTKSTIYLNSYKTAENYGEYKLELSKNIHNIFKKYLLVNMGDTMFLNSYYGVPISKNNLSKLLIGIFDKYLGKKISTTCLRKNYLTNKYGEVLDNMKDDAKIMMHSVDTAQKIYINK
jgi:hypothetical protein